MSPPKYPRSALMRARRERKAKRLAAMLRTSDMPIAAPFAAASTTFRSVLEQRMTRKLMTNIGRNSETKEETCEETT